MESFTHLDPIPPERGVVLPCFAATACSHHTYAADDRQAHRMLADHIRDHHPHTTRRRTGKTKR